MTDKIKKGLLGIAALAALATGGSAIAGAAGGGNDKPAQGRGAAAQELQNEAPEAPGGKETENRAADPDNVQDENGKDDATETSEPEDEGEHSDKPVTGDAATRAKEAALAKTGGGKAGDVEAENEKGASYAVEVTKTDGSQVDVRLDDQFKVVSVDSDDEQSGTQDESGERGEAPAAGEQKKATP